MLQFPWRILLLSSESLAPSKREKVMRPSPEASRGPSAMRLPWDLSKSLEYIPTTGRHRTSTGFTSEIATSACANEIKGAALGSTGILKSIIRNKTHGCLHEPRWITKKRVEVLENNLGSSPTWLPGKMKRA